MNTRLSLKFGSVCSGIDAASVALNPLGFKASWFSEIEGFPSAILKHHYPDVTNIGDMTNIPQAILSGNVYAPEVLCGGTPCQAFSLAGLREGLGDDRGNLTLKFIEIADAIDAVRKKEGQKPSVILWENVEGALSDKTNAFGLFIAGLCGSNETISSLKKWSTSGMAIGPKRQVYWRVIDAKHFGLPQQRRRLFVIATARNECAAEILFERGRAKRDSKTLQRKRNKDQYEIEGFFGAVNHNECNIDYALSKKIKGISLDVFRHYTDCLYAAYGTKWNGNAAAYNGSLFVAENQKLRRLTPLECERLMGFPDNYTLIDGAKDTSRYKAVGNSWAVPVINWIGIRLKQYLTDFSHEIP